MSQHQERVKPGCCGYFPHKPDCPHTNAQAPVGAAASTCNAVAAERERCAKIAETQIEANASHGCEYEYELAAQIAARIRSGK